jgi:hypothetical protein
LQPRSPSDSPLVLSLGVAVALLAAGPAGAATQGEDPDAPDPEDTWLDRGHSLLEEKLFAPVVAFDRFFSDERDLELERARSFVQLRNELRLDESGRPAYAPVVRANLRLPGVNAWLQRFRLVLEGQARDAYTALFPGQDGADPSGTGGAEVRFGLWDGLVAHADLGAGVLFKMPPGAFTRLRLRFAFPVHDLFLARLATSGFWRTDTRLGTSAEGYLERPLTGSAVLRLASDAQLTQRSRGVEWSSELGALLALAPRSAVAAMAGLRGATEGPAAVERYRVAARFRRDLFRDWLFFELEPEVYWPWSPLLPRRATLAVTLRLDVQFHGSERGAVAPPVLSPPPPPVASEPLDPAEPPRAAESTAPDGAAPRDEAPRDAPRALPSSAPARL